MGCQESREEQQQQQQSKRGGGELVVLKASTGQRTLLHIDSSPGGDGSISRSLTAEYVRNWKGVNPNGRVVVRDLTTTSIAPVDGALIGAFYTPADKLTSVQRSQLALSDRLISELEVADEYVIGVPMHNFWIPAVMKLWVDQVARVGKTFSYATGSPQGLLKGKKATVIVAAGAQYEPGSALASYDFVVPYVRSVLGFIGVTDVTFVLAGGASALQHGKVDRNSFLKPLLEQIRAKF